MTLAAGLADALQQTGYRHALAPAGVSRELYDEIGALRDQGLLADRLFASYQEYWRVEAPDGVGEPRTLIVVAWPSLPLKVRFQLELGPLDAIVPPTYISSVERAKCLEVVRSVLGSAGYGVGWARVPVKLLAVRTGLAQYGRNNIAYTPLLGSYVRLGAICTDAELGATGWKAQAGGGACTGGPAHAFMPQCAKCHACRRACPTGCIPEDGTVIDAARCLTEANENEGGWPAWVTAQSHNSLVGCMRCQEACPVNRSYLGNLADVVAEFDREETDLVLRDLQPAELPAQLRAKLAGVDLDEYSPVLGRNLRALRDAAAVRANN
jgi:epoxyqueuosine reductase